MAMKVNANRMCGDITAFVMQKGIDGQTNGQHRSFAYAQRHYNTAHQYSTNVLVSVYNAMIIPDDWNNKTFYIC